MDCSTSGFHVHCQLPELTQTHVHRVGDAIQPSHPLLTPSLPAFNLSQHQGLLQWVTSLHPHGLYSPWNSPGQNTEVGSHSLLQGIFLTQGLNPGLLHCRILSQMSHQGSPRILEWVAYSFFLTQESSPGFLHCRWTFHQLSYKGNYIHTNIFIHGMCDEDPLRH